MVWPFTIAIWTGVAVVAAVDRAGLVGPVGVGVEAAGCRVVCVCDVGTDGLRAGVVLRFVVCASEAGANASERVKTTSTTRGLIGAGRFIRGCFKPGCFVGAEYFIRVRPDCR